MNTEKIFITGFMGSGKSTIGKLLARQLNYKFLDSDDEIESKYDKSVKQIFADEGEAWFRNIEELVIKELVLLPGPLVISLGGGALMSKKNQMTIASNGLLVYIKSSPEQIFLRIRHSRRRPLLSNDGAPLDNNNYLDKITRLLNQREPGYNTAQLIFNRDPYEKEECAKQLAMQIRKLGE